jgi:fluoride exporter
MAPGLLLMVGIGGALGSYARYRVSAWVQAHAGTGLPWGTLTVNLAGSFLLGLLLPLLHGAAPLSLLEGFVTVGVLGAFTTFSTLALELKLLLQHRRWLQATLYLAGSFGIGILAVVAGMAVGLRLA